MKLNWKYCWYMLNPYGQRLPLFSWWCTHFIKSDSHCDSGCFLFQRFQCAWQIKPGAPDHYCQYSLFGLGCHEELIRCNAHLHERPRHPSETTEPCRPAAIVNTGLSSLSLSPLLSYSLSSHGHTRSARHKRIIACTAKKKKMTSLARDLICYQFSSASF